MPQREIRIGSRTSELAVKQTTLVMQAIAQEYPQLKLRLVTMTSQGDRQPDLPLEGVYGKGLFTGTLEQALREGEIDLCIHSLKDMALVQPADLPIVAYSHREDPRDALVLANGAAWQENYTTGKSHGVGCSSARRRLQLSALLPQWPVLPIRGNVPTRIAKLDGGQYGAVVLAMAGLRRLGLAHRASRIFTLSEMLPAAGQGILAIQGRRGEDYSFLDAVASQVSAQQAKAERQLVAALGGDCGSPCGAYAQIEGEEIRIWGMFASQQGSPIVRDTIVGARDGAQALAEKLAARLIRELNSHG